MITLRLADLRLSSWYGQNIAHSPLSAGPSPSKKGRNTSIDFFPSIALLPGTGDQRLIPSSSIFSFFLFQNSLLA